MRTYDGSIEKYRDPIDGNCETDYPDDGKTETKREAQAENWFEGQEGQTGPIQKVSRSAEDIEEFRLLAWDVDGNGYREGFPLIEHIEAVIPTAEIRQTGKKSYHVVQRFDPAIEDLERAKRIWKRVQRLLLADPHSNWLMNPRVVGSVKAKRDCRFEVCRVKAGTPVSVDEMETRASGREELYRILLTGTLKAENGDPLWDGRDSHGVCPLHGTGANPGQASYEPDKLQVACWADCKEGQQTPGIHSLFDIVRGRVLSAQSFAAWRDFLSGVQRKADGRLKIPWSSDWLATVRRLRDALGQCDLELYIHGDELVRVRDDRLERIAEGKKLSAIVREHVQFYKPATEDSPERPYEPPERFFRELLHADSFLGGLPEITSVSRVPVYVGDEVAVAGYNEDVGLYLTGDEVCPAADRRILDEFLDHMHFESDADMANYLGELLSPFIRYIEPDAPLRNPGFVHDGNRPGVGKTSAAKVSYVLAEDRLAETVQFNRDEGELEKRLGARIQNTRVVIVDNCKTSTYQKEIASTSLERMISDEVVTFRRLGYSQEIRRENDLLVILTMNNAALGPDLINRSVFVRFECSGPPEKHHDPGFDPVLFAWDHRDELRAALLGMVKKWTEEGRPLADGVPFRFQRWSRIVGGILKANGIPAFLGRRAERVQTADPQREDLRELCRLHPEQWWTASEWLKICEDHALLSEQLCKSQSSHWRSTQVGKLLSSYTGDTFQVGEKVYQLRSKQSGGYKQYAFVIIGESDEDDMVDLVGLKSSSPTTSPTRESPSEGDIEDSQTFVGLSRTKSTAQSIEITKLPSLSERGGGDSVLLSPTIWPPSDEKGSEGPTAASQADGGCRTDCRTEPEIVGLDSAVLQPEPQDEPDSIDELFDEPVPDGDLMPSWPSIPTSATGGGEPL